MSDIVHCTKHETVISTFLLHEIMKCFCHLNHCWMIFSCLQPNASHVTVPVLLTSHCAAVLAPFFPLSTIPSFLPCTPCHVLIKVLRWQQQKPHLAILAYRINNTENWQERRNTGGREPRVPSESHATGKARYTIPHHYRTLPSFHALLNLAQIKQRTLACWLSQNPVLTPGCGVIVGRGWSSCPRYIKG